MTTFETADDATKTLASRIIEYHHPDLMEADILILMRSPPAKSKGQEVLGKARLSTPIERALTGRDLAFTIELQDEWWSTAKASQKEALLDHELCHCVGEPGAKGETEWSLRGHDIEEFFAIVERHGSWSEAVSGVKRALQMDLFRGVGVTHDMRTGEVVEA